MSQQAKDLAVEIVKQEEKLFRVHPDGSIRSYADPYSPLGKALVKAGLWLSYLHFRVEVPASMKSLSGAPWTIGYGQTQGIKEDTIWTREQAEADVVKTVNKVANRIIPMIKKPATPNQLAAMIDLAYNIGETNFSTSTLLKKFNAGDVAGAANEFPRWNKAGGVVSSGLTKRRALEVKIFNGGSL